MRATYSIVVERGPETGCLVGEVVELPGCYTQAPDLPTLDTNMCEAIKAYRETADLDEPSPDFVGTWRIEVPA